MTPISVQASPASSLGRWRLIGIFVLALAPRLALAGEYLHAPIGLDDMYQYDMLARSLAAGKGYRWYQRQDVAFLLPYLSRFYETSVTPTAVPEDGYLSTFRAPGYPFFLAGLYLLAGTASRLAAARIVQASLTATLGPLTAWIAPPESGCRLAPPYFRGSPSACIRSCGCIPSASVQRTSSCLCFSRRSCSC
jgi:hypothetical protein